MDTSNDTPSRAIVSRDLKTRVCDICTDPDTPELEIKYLDKKLTADEIKHIKHWSQYAWYHHVKHHLKPDASSAVAQNADFFANLVVDKTGQCIRNLDELNTLIERVKPNITADADPGKVKAFVSLLTESRHTIETMAHIQGEFKDTTLIQINNITSDYNELMGIIMEVCCLEDKQKIMARLNKPIPGVLKPA